MRFSRFTVDVAPVSVTPTKLKSEREAKNHFSKYGFEESNQAKKQARLGELLGSVQSMWTGETDDFCCGFGGESFLLAKVGVWWWSGVRPKEDDRRSLARSLASPN